MTLSRALNVLSPRAKTLSFHCLLIFEENHYNRQKLRFKKGNTPAKKNLSKKFFSFLTNQPLRFEDPQPMK